MLRSTWIDRYNHGAIPSFCVIRLTSSFFPCIIGDNENAKVKHRVSPGAGRQWNRLPARVPFVKGATSLNHCRKGMFESPHKGSLSRGCKLFDSASWFSIVFSFLLPYKKPGRGNLLSTIISLRDNHEKCKNTHRRGSRCEP